MPLPALSRKPKPCGVRATNITSPRMVFVNKMDRTGADFYRCVEMIKKQLTPNIIILQLPIGNSTDYKGPDRSAPHEGRHLGKRSAGREIPRRRNSCRHAGRGAKISPDDDRNAVECDDAAMEAYLEGKEPSVETMDACIRKGTIARSSCRFFAVRLSRTRAFSLCLTPLLIICLRRLDIGAVKGYKPGVTITEENEEAKHVVARTAGYGAFLRSCFQGHQGSVRRFADLRSYLFGHAANQHLYSEQHQGRTRTRRPYAC